MAGITALFACFPIIHVVIGLSILTGKGPFGGPSDFPPSDDPMGLMVGIIFTVVGSLVILGGWTLAVCMVVAGQRLGARRRRTFCMVVAGIECIFMPFGTVLGVLSLVVLSRPSVKELFSDPAAGPVFPG